TGREREGVWSGAAGQVGEVCEGNSAGVQRPLVLATDQPGCRGVGAGQGIDTGATVEHHPGVGGRHADLVVAAARLDAHGLAGGRGPHHDGVLGGAADDVDTLDRCRGGLEVVEEGKGALLLQRDGGGSVVADGPEDAVGQADLRGRYNACFQLLYLQLAGTSRYGPG